MIDTELLVLLVGVANAAGTFGGILAGPLGVGGGIVIVPALYLVLSTANLAGAVAIQVAVASSLATIVVAAASSARAHHLRDAVDREILRRWSPWVNLGVIAGSLLGAVVDGRTMVAVFATVVGIMSLNMRIGRGKIEHSRIRPRRRSLPRRGGGGRYLGNDGPWRRHGLRPDPEVSGLRRHCGAHVC